MRSSSFHFVFIFTRERDEKRPCCYIRVRTFFSVDLSPAALQGIKRTMSDWKRQEGSKLFIFFVRKCSQVGESKNVHQCVRMDGPVCKIAHASLAPINAHGRN